MATLDARWLLRVAGAVLVRPGLWGVAIAQVLRLAPRGWWRRAPRLPLPDARYLEFRLQTQYGRARPAAAADVVTWLRWCRRWHRTLG